MIGESVKRIDSFDKVTGRACYVSDFEHRYPEYAYVKAVRSPYAHAKVLSIDSKKALQIPGVIGVYTYSDFDVNWKKFPQYAKMAKDEVVWAGQAVAFVVADTEMVAFKASQTVEVEYEKLPFILNWKDSIKDNPVSIIDKDLINRKRDPKCRYFSPNVSAEYHLRKGNTDDMWKQADYVVEGEFSAAKKSHNQLEKPEAIVEYSPENLTIISNGCSVHRVIKENICEVFGLPRSNVRAIQPYTGGSFGNRNTPYMELIAVMLALKTKRSLVYKFTREEMFTASPSNWNCGTRIKLGAKKDGTFVALDYEVFEEIGASVANNFYSGMVSYSSICSTYKVENVISDAYAVLTNTVPSGSYRGPGTPESVFGLETLINRLALKMGMSPIELRLKNVLHKNDLNFNGQKITSVSVGSCLEAVGSCIKKKPLKELDSSEWKTGIGFACAAKQNSPIGRSEAIVLYHEDGKIEVRISCDNVGMGATTAIAQIAAEEFKSSIDDVCVKIADTDITPFDHYSASCRSIFNTGSAVKFACEDAIRQLKEEVARVVGVVPQMVEIRGKKAIITGSNIEEVDIHPLFLKQNKYVQNIWGLKSGTPVVGHGIFSAAPAVPFDQDGRSPRLWNWFQYASTGVRIAVNTRTGQIKILEVANAADSGNPINPTLVRNQLEGGTHMSIGFSINEEHVYDENGKIANANLLDYRLPTVFEMPDNENVHCLICPDSIPDGPYGAKGMAECICAAMAPAIGDALRDALGIDFNQYPFTAERVLNAIKESKNNDR